MNLIKLIQIIRSVPIGPNDLFNLAPFENKTMIKLKKAKDIAEAVVNRQSEWR